MHGDCIRIILGFHADYAEFLGFFGMCRAVQVCVGIMWDYFGSCRAALGLCREYVCISGLIGNTLRVMWDTCRGS